MSDPTEGRTFREAYALLQKHAQALRAEQEPDIDNLTTIVRESLEAWQVCKARIDAVEKALEASLGEADASGAPRPRGDDEITPASPSIDGRGQDDDIPF